MKIKGIVDYDCVNYKNPCLTVMFPTCTFKCDKDNNCKICQNWALTLEPSIEVSYDFIINYYLQNPLTKAFCFQGLEPFDSFSEMAELIKTIRIDYSLEDEIIIYTGYNPEEKEEEIKWLKLFPNIIIKWGRFIVGEEPHYDELLGINLASKNQYGEKIS